MQYLNIIIYYQRISAKEALMDPLFDFCKHDPRYLNIMEVE